MEALLEIEDSLEILSSCYGTTLYEISFFLQGGMRFFVLFSVIYGKNPLLFSFFSLSLYRGHHLHGLLIYLLLVTLINALLNGLECLK